jgi:hypothetical protein
MASTVVRVAGIAAGALGVMALVVVACEQQAPTNASDSVASSRTHAIYPSTRFCTKCHGGLDNGTGAPPYDLAGNGETTRPSIGAHSAHVESRAIARALDCGECHPQTEEVCTTLHLDNVVEVDFGATARSHGVTPTYDSPGCTNWCHGAGLAGGTNTTPSWTVVGQGEAACGTCHGIPPIMPSAGHPVVQQGTRCRACHPETMTVDYMGRDVLVVGGPRHVNGIIEVEGHGDGWYVPTSPWGGEHGGNVWNGAGPITMDRYYVECTVCHGDGRGEFTVDGGWSGVGCGSCHAAFFVTQQPVGDRCGGYTGVPCTSCIWCH